MNECPALPVQRVAPGCSTGQGSLTAELVACLTLHVQAMQEQTAAINRLAQSNEMLVQAMAEGDEQDSDAEPRTYMDGSVVR